MEGRSARRRAVDDLAEIGIGGVFLRRGDHRLAERLRIAHALLVALLALRELDGGRQFPVQRVETAFHEFRQTRAPRKPAQRPVETLPSDAEDREGPRRQKTDPEDRRVEPDHRVQYANEHEEPYGDRGRPAQPKRPRDTAEPAVEIIEAALE